MNVRHLTIALVLTVCSGAAASGQASPIPAAELIHEVVANELADRVQRRKWMYVVNKREGSHTLTKEQVDTEDGPVYRLLSIDGKPLDADQRQQDNARMDRLIHDPGQQLKFKRAHDEDEQKLETLMGLMSEAFLYDYDGVEGTFIRLRYRPNPSYNPPNYEAQVFHSLAGTILVDRQQKRLAKFSGHVIDRVGFGYGILGHIDDGSAMEIGRLQVGPSQWKTALISIQLSGRLVFFKTIDKRRYETRSGFRAVSSNLSVLEASQVTPFLQFCCWPRSPGCTQQQNRRT